MERESFEDEEVARILNERYVPIKVDREERPDVDHIYMMVCQAMTGSGGWPLTVVMTPDKRPFFAGTYFPKRGKWGRPGLLEILEQVARIWEHQREKVDKIVEQIREQVLPYLSTHEQGTLGPDTLHAAFQLYRESFDAEYGGFGTAPKFPTPHNLLFLLRYGVLEQEASAVAMVEKTLDSMYRGGIYDHIGYGFARYAVDQQWLVPHFEKMLYDNALLAYTYLETYQATRKQQYAQVAREIFHYVLRDMTDPEGGFYSAEDADSEGEEGKFYLWTPDEVKHVLGEEAGELFCQAYDIREAGNFAGKSIPNQIGMDLEKLAERLGRQPDEVREQLQTGREKLFAKRDERVHPGKDDKILTSWNGLMIAALAKGAQVLGEKRYRQAAERAATFIFRRLRREDGRLLARYRDGEAAYLAYLDDYAFLIWGLLELYQTTLEPRYLQDALALEAQLNHLFWDEQAGGYFFYGRDGEALIVRPKEVYDGATPSGNSVSAYNLIRLYHLTGQDEYLARAERLLASFAGNVQQYPPGYSFALLSLQALLYGYRLIVVAGRRADPQTRALLAVLRETYHPLQAVVLNDPAQPLKQLAPHTADKTMREGKAAAYVCENFACQAPLTEAQALRVLLQSETQRKAP